jgi:hypothetical protein
MHCGLVVDSLSGTDRLNNILECVAEMTKRPLLSLTSGDLGITAVMFQSRLDKYLRLGERWGAIVLIDEADVFLEERAKTDIKRNSIVSSKFNVEE